MKESNVNDNAMQYIDMLRETQQAEFPLLGEVTQGLVDDPLTLMNAQPDEDGVVVPCALPDAMTHHLPEMMSEPLSLYEDADVRTMMLAAMMPTLGSAMSHVRVRHERRLYAPGMMNVCVCVGPSGPLLFSPPVGTSPCPPPKGTEALPHGNTSAGIEAGEGHLPLLKGREYTP